MVKPHIAVNNVQKQSLNTENRDTLQNQDEIHQQIHTIPTYQQHHHICVVFSREIIQSRHNETLALEGKKDGKIVKRKRKSEENLMALIKNPSFTWLY